MGRISNKNIKFAQYNNRPVTRRISGFHPRVPTSAYCGAAPGRLHKKFVMKKFLLTAAAALIAMSPLSAQRLVIGERSPEVRPAQWLNGVPDTDNRALMVEFFHSSNKKSMERLPDLDQLARANGGKLTVIVITRENDPAVTSALLAGDPSYFVGYDGDGSVSSAFTALYVPYSVISDKRGRILWLGNPSSLSNADVAVIIK